MKMCEDINLKLSPSKFKLSSAVKFGETIISSQKIKDGHVIFLDPPDQRIVAVTEMQSPKSKNSATAGTISQHDTNIVYTSVF